MSAKYERELRTILEANGFLVIRSAGSFGIDLISYKDQQIYLFEQKDSRADTLYNSNPRLKAQYDELQKIYFDHQITPIYAIRFIDNTNTSKEKKWRLYTPNYASFKAPIFRKESGTTLHDWLINR